MGDENPICTLGDYSKPSHEGYRNTNEFPIGNNVVPLRSDTIWLVQNGCSFHGLRRTIDQSVDGKLCDLNPEESWAILEDLALYDNESWNDPRDFAKSIKEIPLPQDVLRQHQDDMIGKINLLWKSVSEKLNDISTPENAGNSMAHKSIAAISHDKKEELRNKGIKSPSKLFSPKYLSPTSIKELNKNPSALKHVHYVNSIVILNRDSDTKEEYASSTNTHEHVRNQIWC
ncbi:hypothetical protein Tco_0079356 [Tanacetum coccineum]